MCFTPLSDMKNQQQPNNQNKVPSIGNNRPTTQNKDNLDSRENLELNDDNVGGHNKKATHEGDEAKTELNDKRGEPRGK